MTPRISNLSLGVLQIAIGLAVLAGGIFALVLIGVMLAFWLMRLRNADKLAPST